MEETGFYEYAGGEGVTLIEWAELIEEIIPETAVWITIKKDIEKGFDYRSIEIN
jgi:tRNA threonylcarbamoyladenosine biosynthesis protein TsaE